MSGFVRPPAINKCPLTTPEAVPPCTCGEGALTVNEFATGSYSQVVPLTESIVAVS
jgi:hypothetical protein